MTTERYREKSDVPENDNYTILYQGTTVHSVTPQTSFSRDWQMTDHVIPGFHRKIRDGEIISNPCVLATQSVRHSDNHATWKSWSVATPEHYWIGAEDGNHTQYLADRQGYPYGWNHTDKALIDNTFALEEARLKCLANIDSTPYAFLEDIAEILETLAFLGNPLQSLRQVLKAYKRKKDRIISKPWESRKKAKALADLWNQYRFAASPLVRSILDAVDLWHNYDKLHRNERRTAHGFSSSEANDYVGEQTVMYGSGAGQQITSYWLKYKRVQNVHSAIVYEVDNPVKDVFWATGTRLKDIPVVMWEVLPLSFMVDRLVDVKSSLQALINLADPRVSILSCSDTKRETYTREICAWKNHYPYGAYAMSIDAPDSLLFEDFLYDRSEWSPTLYDYSPPVNWKGLTDSATKTADLISIILSLTL